MIAWSKLILLKRHSWNMIGIELVSFKTGKSEKTFSLIRKSSQLSHSFLNIALNAVIGLRKKTRYVRFVGLNLLKKEIVNVVFN